MRKLSGILILLLLVFSMSFVVAQDEPITLEFWGGWTGSDGDVMRALVDQYMEENPNVTINFTIQQWSPLFDSFRISASAGESPDILALHPQEMPMFAAEGLLMDLEPLIEGREALSPENFPEAAWNPNIFQDTLYALPLDVHMHGLFYNVDIFEEAGLDGPPTTGEELLEMGRMLTVDANGLHPGDEGFDPENVERYAINMHTNHHAFFQWWGLYNQLGGEFLSEDGMSCAWDIDKATEAWQWLQDLVYVHNIAPQGQTDYPRDFLDGRTAMLIDGPWRMSALEVAREDTDFNWASAEYPQVFDNPGTWGSAHSFSLPTLADEANREAALDFVEWVIENSSTWATGGQIPVYAGITETEFFQELPGRDPFVEMVDYSNILPNTAKYNEIFASNAPTPMMVMAQSIMLEGAEVRPAVEAACNEIDLILSVP